MQKEIVIFVEAHYQTRTDMFYRTKKYYEVFAYDDIRREPKTGEKTTSKAHALRLGKAWAKIYRYVEVSAVYVNADDESDIQGADLLYSNSNDTEQ